MITIYFNKRDFNKTRMEKNTYLENVINNIINKATNCNNRPKWSYNNNKGYSCTIEVNNTNKIDNIVEKIILNLLDNDINFKNVDIK